MLPMSAERLAEITDHYDLWTRFGDPIAFRPEDAADLMADLMRIRELYEHERALRRRAWAENRRYRAELERIACKYRAATTLAEHWAEENEEET